jgi:hypothetical protein
MPRFALRAGEQQTRRCETTVGAASVGGVEHIAGTAGIGVAVGSCGVTAGHERHHRNPLPDPRVAKREPGTEGLEGARDGREVPDDSLDRVFAIFTARTASMHGDGYTA